MALCNYILALFLCVNYASSQYGDQFPVQLNTTKTGSPWWALLHLPGDYNTTTTKYPLIMFFHGLGEKGSTLSDLSKIMVHAVPKMIKNGANMEFTVKGKTWKFIAVSPQSPSSFVGATSADYMIQDLIANYRVDTSRIYLTGLSAGGWSVHTYVTYSEQFASKIAAVAPISAAPISNPTHLCYIVDQKMPWWSWCGDKDSYYTSMLQYAAKMNNSGTGTGNLANCPGPNYVPPITTTVPGQGHSDGVWDKAYDVTHKYANPNMYEWLLQFRNDTTGPVVATTEQSSTNAVSGTSASVNGSVASGSAAVEDTVGTGANFIAYLFPVLVVVLLLF